MSFFTQNIYEDGYQDIYKGQDGYEDICQDICQDICKSERQGEVSFLRRFRSFPFPVCSVRKGVGQGVGKGAGKGVGEVRRLGRGVFFRASLRLGIFGGAFDPAHRGHASLAIEAQRRLLLGRVLWLVSRCPPLKALGAVSGVSGTVSPFRKRYASAERVATAARRFGGEFCVSDLEEGLGMTFSDEVLWSLRRSLREYDLVFLLGSDGFAEISRWRSWRVLAGVMSLAIFSRRGTDVKARLGLAARVLPCARRGSSLLRLAGRGAGGSLCGRRGSYGVRWGFVSMPFVDASSSALRGGGRKL